MKLIEILNTISKISKENGLSQPYICGGTPRDRILNKVKNIEDVDITTGDSSIHELAKFVAKEYGPSSNYKVLDDGHAQMIIGGLKFDFSSNFIVPGLNKILQNAGLESPTNLKLEMYSRDFTVNALLMTIDLKKIIDPIGLGFEDIKKKTIRTCLPARITLTIDTRRAVRAIYVAAKLGFSLDQEIIDFISKNPNVFTADGDAEYVIKKLNKAFEYNSKLTLQLLDEMNLWHVVPASDKLMPYLRERLT